MLIDRRLLIVLCGILLGVMPLPGQSTFGQGSTTPADPAPARVTTDTPEYCWSLARRIDSDRRMRAAPTVSGSAPSAASPAGSSSPAMSAAEEASQLTVEGRRMCDRGLVVGGLARLRRAWMLLHPGD